MVNELGEKLVTGETTCVNEVCPSRGRGQKASGKRLGSVWRHAAGEQLEQVRKTLNTEEPSTDECIIGMCL